jgi:PAB1-binding protein PBP1
LQADDTVKTNFLSHDIAFTDSDAAKDRILEIAPTAPAAEIIDAQVTETGKKGEEPDIAATSDIAIAKEGYASVGVFKTDGAIGEILYTTELDRSGADFKARESAASLLADEIKRVWTLALTLVDDKL